MAETASKGYVQPSYERDTHYVHDRITSDGTGEWPVEPGRYRLVVARALSLIHI